MTTLVIGASTKPERYSHKAVLALQQNGFDCIAYGTRNGNIGAVEIETTLPHSIPIDTITLYINPQRQTALIANLIELNPRRIIFNPGTENPVFLKRAQEVGILTEIACTLVLLATDSY